VYYGNQLTPREACNLLIAAMMHDFDHIGRAGNDDHNIALALEGLRKHVLEEDRPHLTNIEYLIGVTRYPYDIPSDQIGLCGQILRDADLSQALSVAWIQQVVFGLGVEWNTGPFNVLKMQASFFKDLKFTTTWARELFPQDVLEAKIQEAQDLVRILEKYPKK
jgi:hypothetical protein